MAYLTIPAATRTSAPGTADDSTKGFFRGSIVVNTATSPDTAYVCIDNTASAAVWQQIGAGGVSAHPDLTTLGWSASGHTGTTQSVACFNGTGAAQTVQAVEDGSSLTYKDGVLQFLVTAAAIAVINQSARTLEIEFNARTDTYTIVADDSIVATGSFV
jgi:hypothetical protein